MLRVHEGPVDAPTIWREVPINKKTTVHDVVVSFAIVFYWLGQFYCLILIKLGFLRERGEYGRNMLQS